jgi:hypothetical protein
LRKTGLWFEYLYQFEEQNKRAKNRADRILIKQDFKRIIYEAADPYFTWERMVGMCSICTGFWIALACGIYFKENFLHLGAVVIISHVTLRIFNKIV